jgi:hypothetical protein
MQSSIMRTFLLTFWFSLSLIFGIGSVQAEEKQDMQGWGIDDPYNQHYDVREFERIRGWFVRVKEVVPMPGMSPATVMEVREGAYIHEVHLCPTWYRKPSEIRLKKNERIKIKGVWAEINGKDIFMASKVKKRSQYRYHQSPTDQRWHAILDHDAAAARQGNETRLI